MVSRRTGIRIIVIELALIVAVVGGIAVLFFMKQHAPTCFDNVRNQGEEGVDCGGPCIPCELKDLPPLEAKDVRVFPDGDKIDVLFSIANPAAHYGLRTFHYTVTMAKDGTPIAEGDSFLLPGQTKYVAAFKIEKPPFFSTNLAAAVTYRPTDWIKPRITLQPVQVSGSLRFTNGKYSVSGSATNALLVPVPVRVYAFLTDQGGQIITFNASQMTLNPSETRNVGIVFPAVPSGQYGFRLVPEVDLFAL